MLCAMDGVRQKLKEALDARGIRYAEASRRCSKNHAYIQQFIRRGTPHKLPEEVRYCLAELLGVDERELREPASGVTAPERSINGDGGPAAIAEGFSFKGRLGGQPEITGKAGAGPGEMPQDQVIQLKRGETMLGHAVKAEWYFPPDYLRELGTSPAATWLMPVIGDSMSPTLETGDRVLIDTSYSAPIPDGIYVIDEGHGPIVKRVNLVRRSEPAEYEIISDNEINKPYRMLADEVRIIGRVCGRVTRM